MGFDTGLLESEINEVQNGSFQVIKQKTFWHGCRGWTRLLFISSEIGYSISEDRLSAGGRGFR
jgi:hypothetical protein